MAVPAGEDRDVKNLCASETSDPAGSGQFLRDQYLFPGMTNAAPDQGVVTGDASDRTASVTALMPESSSLPF